MDASWYLLKVREELHKLGNKLSKLDKQLFYFYKGQELIETILLFVDYLFWEGKPIHSDHEKAKSYITDRPRKSESLHVYLNKNQDHI